MEKMVAIRFNEPEEFTPRTRLWVKTLNQLLENKRYSYIQFYKTGIRYYRFPDTYALEKIAEEIYLLIEPFCCSKDSVMLQVSATDYSSYNVYPLMDIYNHQHQKVLNN